jgi:hypothetical protein
MRLRLAVALLLAGCSGSSSTSGADGGPHGGSSGGVSHGCKAYGTDLCSCMDGYPDAGVPCNAGSVFNSQGLGGGACCRSNDSVHSCDCWAFVCDNYAAGLSMNDCTCGWFGESNPQSSCTGGTCCTLPASGFGSSADDGACHCGDTPCSGGQTQVAHCDLSTTPPRCPPGTTPVMSCD